MEIINAIIGRVEYELHNRTATSPSEETLKDIYTQLRYMKEIYGDIEWLNEEYHENIDDQTLKGFKNAKGMSITQMLKDFNETTPDLKKANCEEFSRDLGLAIKHLEGVITMGALLTGVRSREVLSSVRIILTACSQLLPHSAANLLSDSRGLKPKDYKAKHSKIELL